MSLKSIFQVMKNEGYVIRPLDEYLLCLNKKDEGSDRAIDVNAPSQIGTCLRARYYSRLGYEKDGNSIDPRTRRIFDNGTHLHLRLQDYLKNQGMLLLDEVPLRNDEYNIQGHTDGFLRLSSIEIGILEIKSIKTESFQKLKDADPKHKQQAMTYMYCAEKRRLYLQNTYKTETSFKLSLKKRQKYYESLYQHIKEGAKHSKEEKVKYQVNLNTIADGILFSTKKPINKVIIIYEDKNDQNLKEYCVEWDDNIVRSIVEDYETLNKYVKGKKVPNRCASVKSDPACRWCSYKSNCWVI